MTTVLVIDDVAALAEQYAYDLKRVGQYETLVAHSGRDALDILEREAVDCVILDLEMPGMDGFEVLRALERRAFRTPVIVYTGTGNYDRCIQAIRLGARSFIDKAEPMERVVHLVEDELFGHERGAFTGANALRKGAFEAASGGTLFLDEIGELPLPAQAKLLRVIEQRQVTRVGGNRTITVEARVVAATNRDLEA